ncbi:Transcriptional regulator (fragment) [metagenome]|uniref:Transcriptional regulator n=1 Tax=metagenome TaxID=256318 RepID=A0A2P2C8U1_9ZZZZ
MSESRQSAGVQSVHRALDLVEVVARNGGSMSISEIASAIDLPLTTIHRLVRTLVERGYMAQLSDRRYSLGRGLVPLGAAAHHIHRAAARPCSPLIRRPLVPAGM